MAALGMMRIEYGVHGCETGNMDNEGRLQCNKGPANLAARGTYVVHIKKQKKKNNTDFTPFFINETIYSLLGLQESQHRNQSSGSRN